MRVSVILPVHDGGAYIAAALRSVLEAGAAGLEVIVVDDGSRDATPDILRGFADKRLRVLRNDSNLGIVASLNRGIAAARGRYVARMDADDVTLPGRFDAQAVYLDANPQVGVLGGTVLRIDGAGRPLEDEPVPLPTDPQHVHFLLWWHNVINHPTVMARRELLEALGGYRETAYPAEDYDLWLRAAERTGVGNLAAPLLRYRVHEHSITGRLDAVSTAKAEEAAAAAQGRALGRCVAVESVRLIRRPHVLHEEEWSRAAVTEALDGLLDLHERWLATLPGPTARGRVAEDIAGWIAALTMAALRADRTLVPLVLAHRAGLPRRRVGAAMTRRALSSAARRP
jgi:hypothetical protein